MSNPHTYGVSEWQSEQLKSLTVPQLEAEHASTTLDEYRAKVETEFKRRRLPVPDAPEPKKTRRSRK